MKFFQDKKSTHKFSGVFRSRIQDENVTMPEFALGYFLGPFCALLAKPYLYHSLIVFTQIYWE